MQRREDRWVQIKRSGFEYCTGTLHCVLGQETLLSQCSAKSGVEMGTCTNKFDAGGNPVIVY